MQVGEKTHQQMLPQSAALESVSADNPRIGTKRDTDAKAPGLQHGREGRGRKSSVTPVKGSSGVQRVFVLDKRGNPLMPCHPARARELLNKDRAVVVRHVPFVIRLKDRVGGDVQPVRLGVDPGSKFTGMAVSRDENGDRIVLFGLEVQHRSYVIHKKMGQRAAYRRGRRSRNLRYRSPRFLNRTKPKGWLAPSLWSRVQHVNTWATRLSAWCPITAIDLELVRFDTQKLVNPEISGVEYQHGELFGYEVREYLLEKFGRTCVYCDATNVPLNIDHVIPKSRGGTDRITNLVLACVACNQAKGNRPVEEFAPNRASKIKARAKAPLRDAAAVNSTRFATLKVLQSLGVPVECWSGGRTKWNRRQLGVTKSHVSDAACCGEAENIRLSGELIVKSRGRGSHQRTRPDRFGFPRLRFPASKRVAGFATGDLVEANVPPGIKTSGRHLGRVVVRVSGKFRVGTVDGINKRYVHLLQSSDGWEYLAKGREAT